MAEENGALERITVRAQELLEMGYDYIVGLRKRQGQVGPYVFTSREELNDMVIEPRYSLTKFVTILQKKDPDKKVAMIGRGCDERVLKKLGEMGLIDRKKIEVIGVSCTEEEAEECNCEKPIYDTTICTGCWKCKEKCEEEAIQVINPCPVIVPNEFDLNLGNRKAIYVPFPQAVPLKFVRDPEHCLKLTDKLACVGCQEICDAKAIIEEDTEKERVLDVGAIVVATGYDLLSQSAIGEYGYGHYKNVIDGLQFERLCSASGPTLGKIQRPSDGKVPKEVVFIQCVGSRDPEGHLPYCSKICCMYTAKHAKLYKERVRDGNVYVFYIDLRAGGKGYEEFITRITEEDKVLYLRGKVSKIFESPDGKLIVWGADTLTGKKIELKADMVVLATAMVTRESTNTVAKILKLRQDPYGFLFEAHPKLRPVESPIAGMFLAGACQSPKDIPETVAQASGAASKVLALLIKDHIELEPLVAEVQDPNCDGCAYCIEPCPYDAITLLEYMRDGTVKKTVEVNEIICKGCGVCQATCPKNGISIRNFTIEQLTAMVNTLLRS
jgi:heterodisulfide reductase subunit A